MDALSFPCERGSSGLMPTGCTPGDKPPRLDERAPNRLHRDRVFSSARYPRSIGYSSSGNGPIVQSLFQRKWGGRIMFAESSLALTRLMRQQPAPELALDLVNSTLSPKSAERDATKVTPTLLPAGFPACSFPGRPSLDWFWRHALPAVQA